ncbi:threonine-phosphate decarboxylase CobD [Acidisphaera sp. L21]|uniref:threonine-phosphate decarboxylase CobD n=1 Tax=Acidisphaera sp. L21 TaxID=1641851 RepID=UPI00131DC898|nr:threonine-phosphate decarboxylase CobD [Acidisphaera sp. L21]
MAAPIAHGGGLIAAQHRYPDAPRPWLDLSTGINPIAYPMPPLPQSAFTRLPEPEAVAALEALAARTYGVADPACVVAAPGTQVLIHLLPRLIPRTTVAVIAPTYAEHHAAWAQAGHDVSDAPGFATANAAITVTVRPNNPDGRVDPAAALIPLAGPGRLLVVDEAFADLEACSLSAMLPHPRLILLRSFGKTYGLAGVRLGFALTAPALAAGLRQALGPWSVSGPALLAGQAALADAAWRAATTLHLTHDAARLDATLRNAGCHIVGGTRLFRLASHPQAPALATRLAQAGILVRQFAANPTWLRFGLPGTDPDWTRLHSALA